MKYPLEGWQVGTIKGDQGLSRKCYKDILKLKNKILQEYSVTENTLKVNLVDLDPRGVPINDNLTLIGEVKKVQTGIEIF